MINDKKVIAIIPARGGSKGLPGKNIRPLCGKPLIAWSIEQALRSECVDKVLVTTDSEEIANVAKRYGAEVPFIRPSELATDYTPSFEVISHALSYYRDFLGVTFDYSILLEPTSPLRERDDIDEMAKKLDDLNQSFDGIVTIGEVAYHPSIMKKCDSHKLLPVFPELVQKSRRQDHDTVYWPFGTFMTKTDTLLREKSFYPSRLTHYKIKRYQCYEIDDLYDFLCVEAVMKHEWSLK